MICRIWHGLATAANASRYQSILRSSVVPAIEGRHIPGFRAIEMMRRTLPDGDEEFTTIMWFDDLDAVRAFMGPDYVTAHVPAEARAVLSSFDPVAAHYEIIERREQT